MAIFFHAKNSYNLKGTDRSEKFVQNCVADCKKIANDRSGYIHCYMLACV